MLAVVATMVSSVVLVVPQVRGVNAADSLRHSRTGYGSDARCVLVQVVVVALALLQTLKMVCSVFFFNVLCKAALVASHLHVCRFTSSVSMLSRLITNTSGTVYTTL
jgi:hypothetical protein